MRILFESSERDLLNSYTQLLTLDGHEVSAAFDGTQVLSLLKEPSWDILLMEDTPPRISREGLISRARELKIPVIVLLCGRIRVHHLLRADLPEAYLSLPFLPTDLLGLIDRIRDRKSSGNLIPCGDAAVDVSAFRFADSTIRLTAQEMDLLEHLEDRTRPGGKLVRTMLLALNEKLSRQGKLARIAYENGKGYRLVNQDD